MSEQYADAVFQRHRKAVAVVVVGIAVVAQQMLASLIYAGWWNYMMVDKVEPFDWMFWFFWNDYWLFMEFLSWPGRNGTTIALVANVAALMAVLTTGYGIWRWRQ